MPIITIIFASFTTLLLASLSLRISLMRMKTLKETAGISDNRLGYSVRLWGNLTKYEPIRRGPDLYHASIIHT